VIKGKYNGVEIEFDEEKLEDAFCRVSDKDAEVKKVTDERDDFKAKYEEAKRQYEEAFNSNKPKTPNGDELLDNLKNVVKEAFK
jgi:tRNA U38,U39,U40 pseudouridine synthase TruA